MKIAIISDSHGSIDRLKSVFINTSKEGIKNILHAGDFLEEGVVKIFAGFSELNFFIAIGNNDVNKERLEKLKRLSNVEIAEVVFCQLGKYNIAISHYDGVAEVKSREISQKVDIFIHGHTHRPTVVRRGKSTMLNPGALCEDGKCVILDLETMKGKRVFYSHKV